MALNNRPRLPEPGAGMVRHRPRTFLTTDLASRVAANPPAVPDPASERLQSVREEAWGFWEDAERSELPGGLRLVTARLPRSGSVSVTVGLAAGSRFETEAQSGISHVLEHMCFRGSERWPTSFL